MMGGIQMHNRSDPVFCFHQACPEDALNPLSNQLHFTFEGLPSTAMQNLRPVLHPDIKTTTDHNVRVYLCKVKGAVSDFWETLLKVDQTKHQNTLVANHQKGACSLMMGELTVLHSMFVNLGSYQDHKRVVILLARGVFVLVILNINLLHL